MRFRTKVSPPRVRMLVRSPEGKILLVKSVLGMREWELPGGAAAPNESTREAAVRELYEETAIRVESASVTHLHSLAHPFPIELYESHLTVCEEPSIIRPLEIREVEWFLPTALPSGTAEYVKQLFQK